LNKIKLKDKLKQALKEGALTVYYQPIVNADTNHITKFEALVRSCSRSFVHSYRLRVHPCRHL
ncbi:hypothetical protein L1273_21000, partial [Pseudoalteromonas sp. DL2-H6]|uniref:hypothetical protein n=1 Tax=Pseudoalteromonas sp. DL2-H6 TaxID=2908890 RepID=UPI001F1F5885